nr:MAG TPA: hypothetical protein [Caudoviricetes sp.]
MLYYSCPGSSVNRYIKPTCINPRPFDTGSILLVTNIVPVFPGCHSLSSCHQTYKSELVSCTVCP